MLHAVETSPLQTNLGRVRRYPTSKNALSLRELAVQCATLRNRYNVTERYENVMERCRTLWGVTEALRYRRRELQSVTEPLLKLSILPITI